MKRSPFSRLALVLPGVIVLFGIITIFTYNRADSDWGIFSAFGGFIIAIFIGAITSVVFASVAIARKEPESGIGLILAVPSICLLLWVGVEYLRVAL